MKRDLLPVLIILFLIAIVSGCTKTSNVTTINPSMSAKEGTYQFNASTVQPSIVDTQIHDTTTQLTITGNSSDPNYNRDRMILTIRKYKGVAGTFSIVQSQAGACFIHGGVYNVAIGGLVSITTVTPNSLIGYFSFSTATGMNITSGTFNVGKP